MTYSLYRTSRCAQWLPQWPASIPYWRRISDEASLLGAQRTSKGSRSSSHQYKSSQSQHKAGEKEFQSEYESGEDDQSFFNWDAVKTKSKLTKIVMNGSNSSSFNKDLSQTLLGMTRVESRFAKAKLASRQFCDGRIRNDIIS